MRARLSLADHDRDGVSVAGAPVALGRHPLLLNQRAQPLVAAQYAKDLERYPHAAGHPLGTSRPG